MLSVEELNDRLIELAFSEDIGDGDHTTLCCIPADAMGESRLLIKEEGILAGVEIAKKVFHHFDPELQVEVYMEDGSHVKPGDIALSVKGRERSLLQTERLMLNIMQRMSGIATMTHRYQQALIDAGTKTRVLAKQYGKEHGKEGRKIECEVRNFKELEEALAEGCDRIMFDNFTPEDTRKAVEMVGGRCETESSGGITFETMIPYAKAGVDFISFGALTHSVKGLDMSLKAASGDR